MTIDIDAIRQRVESATPGPWVPVVPVDATDDWFDPYDDPMVVTSDSTPGNYCAVAQEIVNGEDDGRADAEFIAHARQDIPALLAKVAELTAERDVARADAANALRALDTARPVIEAAKAWRSSGETGGIQRRAVADLIAAVDALPKTEVAS